MKNHYWIEYSSLGGYEVCILLEEHNALLKIPCDDTERLHQFEIQQEGFLRKLLEIWDKNLNFGIRRIEDNAYQIQYMDLTTGRLYIERKEDMEIYLSYEIFVDDLVHNLFKEEINKMISNYIDNKNNSIQEEVMFFYE